MDLDTWSLYASAVLLLCLTPGPNSLLAVTNGLRFGVGKTLFSTFGCAVGLTLLIGASLSGLGLILAASETVFYVIKWLGACYLIYLGISLIRARGAFADVRQASCPATPPGEIYLFAQGLWIVIMNPKAVIFFAAFLPQFYDPQHGLLPQFLMMAGTFVGIEVVVEIVLAVFASKLAAYVTSGTGMRMFNRATGGVFVLAGAYLLTLERPR
ncbi:MAG: LysE family translocator [Chromatiales bacterium]|nr:LysE family translocator [Chromatiales bacterium]